MRALLRLLLLSLLVLWASLAGAHEMTLAEMELREAAPGDFIWQWTATKGGADMLVPRWPAPCRAQGNRLRCPEGLQGSLTMEGVGQRYSAAMVRIHWLQGGSRVYTLTPSQPTVQLYGAAEDRRGMGEIVSAYTLLGVEHILSGWDHLAFVLGLLFLVGFNRRLFWTITAFTAAHSLTLALSALGWLVLRPPPVEATIALSILLVAGEALHQRPTWSRRWPAAVAFLFGLVHGLGFAGALKEIGLPEQHLALALLSFNLGVEAGQVLVVAACWALWRMLKGWAPFMRARVPALYAIGSLAAYWTLGRVAALLA